MATKTDLFFSKKQQSFVSNVTPSSDAQQYSNLNLNQSYKDSNVSPAVVQSQSKTNNDKSFDFDQQNSQPLKHSLTDDKSSKCFNPFEAHNDEAKDQQWKKDSNSLNTNKKNSSTLSLHISAYENSIEGSPSAASDAADSNNGENEGMKKENSLTKKLKNVKQVFATPSSAVVRNPFEFPRQQKGQTVTDPEVMQFKASQKLLNPKGTTQMGMEVDFPRGGAKPKPHKAVEGEAGLQKRKQTHVEKIVPEKRKREKEDTENEPKVFDKYVKYDMLIEDVRGIGAVSKIEDDSLTLQTINGIRVKIPAKNVSRIYQSTFDKTHATLDDLFKPGQMLAYRVECAKGDKSKEIIASTCPSRVNDCLNASTLLNGIVCNAAVKSIEEKGVVMDLGFDTKLQGFAPNEVMPDVKTLIVGQVILVRIIREKNDSQRFIKVSAYPEMDTFEDEKMTMNHLMPGTVLHAEPISVKDDGILVGFKNGLQAFVSREELPPRVRADLSKLVRAFRVVVVLCRQNSPFLVVSGHPDVVALSKSERRFIPEDFSIGSILEGEVYAVDKNNNVFFNIREDDEKVSLVTAKLMAKNMENPEKIALYRPGSTHKLRVLKSSVFERSLFVTNKKALMNKAVEVQEEFQPGQHVTFMVKVIADTGLRGTIGLHTRATVIVHHTLDLPILTWQKAFKEGQKLKCRVLYKHADKHIYYLTAKPALVNSSDEIISDYSKENIGKFAAGLCAKMLDSGAIISFYDRVKAFLPLSEVKKITGLKEGVAVRGRILMVDPENEKMTIVIGDKIDKDPTTGKKKKDKKSKAVKNLGIYTAKVTGQWKYGGTSEDTTLLVELPDDNIGRLHVSELGKYTSTKKFLKEYKNKPLNVRVINVSKVTSLPKAMREKLTNEKHIKRFYECTFDPKKLNDPKKKQKLLHYKINFAVGDTVSAYLVESSTTKTQKAEINPVFKAQINPESTECGMNDYPDENGITRATPIILAGGECRKGKVTGINRSKNAKVLLVSLENDSKKKLEVGEKTYGRVTAVSKKPFLAKLSLPTGETGLLTASGASESQLSAAKLYQYIKSDDLLTVRCLTKNDEDEWIVACADKQELPEFNNGQWSKSKLYQGYVTDFGKEKTPNVEVFPGVKIAIEKPDQSVHIDDLMVFKVSDSTAGDKSSFKAIKVIREAEATKDELKDDETDDDEEAEEGESDEDGAEDDEVDESDIEMVGADDEDSEMQAIKAAMTKLTKGGRISTTAATAFTNENLQSAKKSLQADAKKSAQKQRGRNESITSIKTQSDDEVDEEEVQLDDNARILHKEKILSGLEKSSELNDDTDYNRLVLANPHSSEAWISYMVYQAQDGNIDEARKVAENALSTINPREEQERLNLFTAYLNLEVASGTEKSLKDVFERALGAFDALEIYKRLANIYLSTKKFDDLEKLYNVMIKKFGNFTRDVWSLYGSFLYKQGRQAEGRDLMKRALNVIPKKHHLEMLCRFANFEYTNGDIERGKTMLEKAVAAAPNRGDLWNVYIDKAIKYQTAEDARLLFERAITNKLGMHTIKNLFQKWQDFEKLRGDEEHLLKVNEKAVQFTKNLKKDIMEAQAAADDNDEEEESD